MSFVALVLDPGADPEVGRDQGRVGGLLRLATGGRP
jgi:hypothetical protein